MPGQPQIVPLVSDLEPMPLPGEFGEASSIRMNPRGDFLFISGRSSGIFLRPAGGAVVRILQRLDQAPGLPDGHIDTLSASQINAHGLVVFDADFMLARGGAAQHGIWAYDGAAYRLVAHTRAAAPGTGGAQYGRTMSCCGLNDAGDISFAASLTSVVGSSAMPARTTLFIAPSGGDPVRIAGPGDPAPDTGGGSLDAIQTVGSLSASGEALFTAAITGGSGGHGLFAGSVVGGLRKIVVHGDARPGGGTFDLTARPAAVINNAGGDTWAAGGTFPAVMPTAFAFNDRGEIGFMTPLDGGPGGGVFVGSVAGLTAVALTGQAAPSGGSYAIDTQVPELDLSDAGDVAFRATLAGGAAESGAFFWRRSDGNVRTILLEGQHAPGTLGVFGSLSRSINGWPSEQLVIGASGDVMATNVFLAGSDLSLGFWRSRADGVLECLFMRGGLAPQSGGGLITHVPQGAAVDDAGRFIFSLGVYGGRFANAIYVTR